MLDFTFEQISDNPNSLHFDARPDGDPLSAFTFHIKHTVPNLTVQLVREPHWGNLYPELNGPDICLISFGPDNNMGRFGYGIIPEKSMAQFFRRSSSAGTSIYFTAQNEREYKWKENGEVLECIDTRTKDWVAQYDLGFFPPQMRIKGDGVHICTELFVTWYLHQHAKMWKWQIKIDRKREAERFNRALMAAPLVNIEGVFGEESS